MKLFDNLVIGLFVAICALVALVLLAEKVNEIDQHVNEFIGRRVNELAGINE